MFDHDIEKELGNTHFADGYEDECADMNFARNSGAAIAETKERFGIDLRHLPEDAPLFVRLYARLLVPNDGVNAIYLNQVRFDMMRLSPALYLNEHKEDGAQYARFADHAVFCSSVDQLFKRFRPSVGDTRLEMPYRIDIGGHALHYALFSPDAKNWHVGIKNIPVALPADINGLLAGCLLPEKLSRRLATSSVRLFPLERVGAAHEYGFAHSPSTSRSASNGRSAFSRTARSGAWPRRSCAGIPPRKSSSSSLSGNPSPA